ncbi:MAG: NADH-quinone oxidoreductase subunit L [Nevskia sp.]
MFDLLFIVFLAPLIGFVTLAFGRDKWSENMAAVIGVGSVGISALVTALITFQFLTAPPEGGVYTQLLWTWIDVGQFAPRLALHLDGLSLTMMCVITGVGFMIHLFASWYMRGDDGYGRFFSYMNLFVMSMLFLVLGDNLLFLYFGWEGVGLASYLLIGFWYQNAANGAAARKAFVVTRIGDTFMAVGLFMLFRDLGTLEIQPLMAAAQGHYTVGSHAINVIALLLLGGAVGKSAQLPLQTWLPDAMAGPTPVSALIHAATMVTAGVYLVARLHVVFELSPFALSMVGLTGALTLLVAGFTALMQTDIKRVLAYSTMSQIGYMFLALGAGAWSGAIFHLMTHAFFKALLFLSSGSVILACHHEQNMFRMGGLRKHIPFVFWCMLIGTLALTAFPPTSGYFSKDGILSTAWANGHEWLWLAGVFGAFLTGIYSFRLIFVTFFGPERWREPAHGEHGHGDAHHGLGPHDDPHCATTLDHHIPLTVLLVLAILGGFIHLPLAGVLPGAGAEEGGEHVPALIEHMPLIVSLLGIFLSWFLFLKNPQIPAALARHPATAWLGRYWHSAFGFDWLYDRVFVKPFLGFVHFNRRDGFDIAVMSITKPLTAFNGLLSRTQTGQIRWYAASVGLGAVLVIAMVALS